MIIDNYLNEGLLTLNQHCAGEYLLDQAQKAGVWATGADLLSTRVQGAKKNGGSEGAFQFLKSLRTVEEKYGWFHAWLVREVIVHDWDISKYPMRMLCLLEALDWIVERRMGGVCNPLKKLEDAAAKTTAPPSDLLTTG